ncbi:MAG TPA: hypothetical protein PLL06_05515 [Acidobacteriota bacterium]|nr:hypothetical protein [Acidobacteriota bacterium]
MQTPVSSLSPSAPNPMIPVMVVLAKADLGKLPFPSFEAEFAARDDFETVTSRAAQTDPLLSCTPSLRYWSSANGHPELVSDQGSQSLWEQLWNGIRYHCELGEAERLRAAVARLAPLTEYFLELHLLAPEHCGPDCHRHRISPHVRQVTLEPCPPGAHLTALSPPDPHEAV